MRPTTTRAEPLTPVIQLLRQQTRPIHDRVESQLALLAPDLSAVRLAAVVQRFYGFWAANEPGIGQWSSDHPPGVLGLDWRRRRRSDLFAHDLVTLGVPQAQHAALPRPPPVFEQVGQPEVFGWLYVTEGSTLGGAIIDHHLLSLSVLGGATLGCFTPYPEGPGPMWRSYRSILQEFAVGHPGRIDAVITAAVATFESLEHWLTPLDARLRA